MGADKIQTEIITTEVEDSTAPCTSHSTEGRDDIPLMNTHMEDEQDRVNTHPDDDDEDLVREEEEGEEELNEDGAGWRGWGAGRLCCCDCINWRVLVVAVLLVAALVYVVWVQSQLRNLEERLAKAEQDHSLSWSELEGLGRTMKEAMINSDRRESIKEVMKGARSSYCNIHRATRDTYDDMMLAGRHLVSNFNAALRNADRILNDQLLSFSV
eukprot:Hpha_TRINITY_DN16421_c2_g3::TRINITY_DN16421_c2_g3_i1::g.158986::m.158986